MPAGKAGLVDDPGYVDQLVRRAFALDDAFEHVIEEIGAARECDEERFQSQT
jgi:hypothetical protein